MSLQIVTGTYGRDGSIVSSLPLSNTFAGDNAQGFVADLCKWRNAHLRSCVSAVSQEWQGLAREGVAPESLCICHSRSRSMRPVCCKGAQRLSHSDGPACHARVQHLVAMHCTQVWHARIATNFTDESNPLCCPQCGKQFSRLAMIRGMPAYKMIGGKVTMK
jgi:hypothetical protein